MHLGARCRLGMLSVLGSRASQAGIFEGAYRSYELAAQGGDVDAMGFQGEMMANGWGGKHSPQEIMDLLEDAALKGSYTADRALMVIYAEGKLVPQDLHQAALWRHRADERQAQVAAEVQASRDRVNGAKATGRAWLVLPPTPCR